MNDVLITGACPNSKIISESIDYIQILLDNNEHKKIKRGIKSKYGNALISMTYKKTLGKLIKEARKHDESLFNAIHLDKTLFDEDWVRKRIRKAFYSGDSKFFKRLGMEIIKPPILSNLRAYSMGSW